MLRALLLRDCRGDEFIMLKNALLLSLLVNLFFFSITPSHAFGREAAYRAAMAAGNGMIKTPGPNPGAVGAFAVAAGLKPESSAAHAWRVWAKVTTGESPGAMVQEIQALSLGT